MSYIDLQATLRDWPYEPDKISVRKILGADEAVRIQMRVELGIIQMEAEGRPDGARPHGSDTLLSYFQRKLAKHQERNGTPMGFFLTPSDCESLRLEASLFYRRYIAYFVLEEFASVNRDTSHSLAIFDLCRDFALENTDRHALEEFRAYVLMMHARANAYQALEEDEPASALAHVNRGLLEIRNHLDRTGLGDFEACEEAKILRTLAAELGGKVPTESAIGTRKALRDAVAQERFEEAAKLRDQLKKQSRNRK
ncbi:MAG: UvrB/UvrC motif-containing protein [Planctomycetes bacterium]|nr:UvrB/UvrC motif-containing protein [Planctomycetota bacterium]MBI3833061.1 UvrB/UvrC motif-containing protein [Planctomycetota bacterium]